MNAKKITLIVLSIFVAASIGYLIFSETREARQPKTDIIEKNTLSNTTAQVTNSSANEKQPLDRVVRVYYFHTTFRCPTCKKIEEYTKNTIFSSFDPEIKKGTIVWNVLNVEEPQNRHFIDDFKLFTKSVVVVDEIKGKQVRWKVLDKTWQLVGDKEGFSIYIQSEVKKFLGGA